MTSTSRHPSLRHAVIPDARAGRWIPFVALLVSVGFVSIATYGAVRENDRRSDQAVRARTDAAVTAVQDRLVAYEGVLYGVRGGFTVDADLSHRRFHDMITAVQVDDRLPGVQVIGAAHSVDSVGLDSYVEQIRELAAESDLSYPLFEVYPETGATDLLPIDFVEPQAGNERAFGLDFLSEANRRVAALGARDTGRSTASGPVTLVQETGTQRAFLVMLPLYERGALTETVTQRRAAFDGVVYAAFRMDDLMSGALGEVESRGVAVLDVESDELLAGDADSPILHGAHVSDDHVGEFEVFGRTWRVMVDDGGSPLSSVERAVPFALALAGLLLAGLIAALVSSIRSVRSRAVALAAEMTGELDALAESTNEGIVSVDADGRIVAWNRGATEIFAVSGTVILGRSMNDLLPDRLADEGDRVLEGLMDGSESGPTSGALVTTGRRADGTEFPAEVSVSTWEARGQRFATGFVRDITDRVEAERRVVETTNMLVGVLGAATELSIIGTDFDGVINVFNAGAERMLGYAADDVVGVLVVDSIHDASEVETRAREISVEPGIDVFVSRARRGEAETRRWTYVCADGRRVPVDLTVTARYDADGEISGFIGVAIDVTERIAAADKQQMLLDQEREMVAKLTEVDRVKNDFVSTMSHELRTPLTSIIGYAELLTDDPELVDSKATAMVDVIGKNAQRLLVLVEDLLTLSRVESGGLRSVRQQCDLGRIASAVDLAIAPLAARHDVEVHLGLEDLPELTGDAAQIERVLLNLMTNAVKFSHPGGIVVVSARPSVSGDEVVLTVADDGIGIAEDEQKHLFARFFRSRSAEKNVIAGTGLGLSIVHNIVQRHGGSVEITSVENEGTTATVILPCHLSGSNDHEAEPDLLEAVT